MNYLKRIKFLIKNMVQPYSKENKQLINCYINDKKLRNNKHYSLVISKLIEYADQYLYISEFGNLIDNDNLQQSDKFDEVIKAVFEKPHIMRFIKNYELKDKNVFADVILQSAKFKNEFNLMSFITLCDLYYIYIKNEKNKGFEKPISVKYKYMVEKFLSVKDEEIAISYYKIFSNTKLLELDEYIQFVDKVFEIKNEGKLILLNKLIINCVKNYNIGVFPMLETVHKINDDNIINILNEIFKNHDLPKLENVQLISLYISQLKDINLLKEFNNLLNNKNLVKSKYFNIIMNNAITIRDSKTLFELNQLLSVIFCEKEYMEIICKLNFEDELFGNILTHTNTIIRLLDNEKISLVKDRIMNILILTILGISNKQIALECLELLEQEVLANINANLIVNNTDKVLISVNSKIEEEKSKEQNVKKIEKN